jgi:hypothetical protein
MTMTSTKSTAGTSKNFNSLSLGFSAISNSGITATDWSDVGKVFGVLGTGKKNTPEFTGYRATLNAAATNFMYISCFPAKYDATVASTIVFKAKSVEFMASTSTEF